MNERVLSQLNAQTKIQQEIGHVFNTEFGRCNFVGSYTTDDGNMRQTVFTIAIHVIHTSLFADADRLTHLSFREFS